MEIGAIPWFLAFVTAVWFGWMSYKAGRNATLWAIGGAAFGLVISTVVLGLGRASTIPFSDHERAVAQTKCIVAAVGIILVLGWALTSSLHRHHLAILRKIKPGAGPAPQPQESKPASPAPNKQSSVGP